MPIEHALRLVAEHVDATVVGVSQARQYRPPPFVGEVLRLVDDDGVEAVSGIQRLGKISHLVRQLVLPEVLCGIADNRLVRSRCRSPFDPELMEFAHVCGSFGVLPAAHQTGQI